MIHAGYLILSRNPGVLVVPTRCPLPQQNHRKMIVDDWKTKRCADYQWFRRQLQIEAKQLSSLMQFRKNGIYELDVIITVDELGSFPELCGDSDSGKFCPNSTTDRARNVVFKIAFSELS